MRTKYYFLLLLSLFCLTAQAQYEAKHALEVKRFTNWAPDYLTVTNTWNNMCITPVVSSLKCMSVVESVNGTSTKDMEAEDFYNVIDASDAFTLTYKTKINGVNKSYTQEFHKRKGKLLITPAALPVKPQTVSLLSDMDVDFFNISTFDYRLNDEDRLMDKTLMEVFSNYLCSKGLKRTTENPDIYLYITKDVNQKIQSVYVPQYTTTTETGSTGIGIGNFLGVRGLSVGGSSGSATTTTVDNGSMRTDVNADAYLEFSILDARKLSSKEAPVIWQLTYSEHATTEIHLLESVKSWIGAWALEYPFHESVMGSQAYTWGLFCNNFVANPVVSDVLPGSKAEAMGCKPGDEIKYVRYSDSELSSCTYRPGESFYANRIIPTTVSMQVGKNRISKGGLTEPISYYFIQP